MRINDIENWALTIIDSVKAKQPVEDTRVELKAKYPDDVKKAARRIAGHANAARGEHILWLIGVDEGANTIPGASLTDLASWYSGVKAEFDELAPEPVSLNIPIDGVTVVALYFETDRAPFVVKNPLGGTVQREVPWREATSIKSASRSQLIRLLTPIQKLPVVEVAAYLVQLSSLKYQDGKERLNFKAMFAIFLTQPTNHETVFPRHRCQIQYVIPNFKSLSVTGSMDFYGCGASNINTTDSFISIRGSGLFEARTSDSFQIDGAKEIICNNKIFIDDMEISLLLYSAEAERSLTLNTKIQNQTVSNNELRQWKIGRHSFYTSPKR